MKCIKKLVALTLAAVLALAMLTACGGTSAPSAPLHETSKEVRTQVLNGLNKTRAELGKPDLKENAEASGRTLYGSIEKVRCKLERY